MPAHLRDFRPGDEAAAYFVCLKTGDQGADGESLYREDPDALGRVYVGPYLRFEPNLAIMLEDDDGVCGYALGAFDSHTFYQCYEREWRPELCKRFPLPAGGPSTWTPVEAAHYLYHHPDYFCPEPYNVYPAHVHIDLLARAQRQGFGRQMMDALLSRLREQGAPGVHLGMHASNDRAYRFYLSLGFEELVRQGEGAAGSIYMGKRLVV